ncbi:winged helix DNA-binding domain-containing protein [Protaetiibacter larvae]|uniref:Winged helix DNA-binding domain-containing protein n=1 Tax=Protaetiibacter larvae TaxID=2592654 RepID=A0A5C1Y6T9_9MICO|nr:winged helix DNA-binding domain-containing protein [Protaetiibacter larvae]QEO09783.1 winged helix DNA-binding domain-containing protein [Protaetiibacter larvae]
MTRTLSARGRRTVTALRLAAQGIARPAGDDPVEVVRSLLAVQAQDYLGALWSVGLRTRGATERSVEDAHRAGGIVRSWPMRGTLHFVAAEDLPWMLSLTGERIARSAAGRHRRLGLEPGDFARAADIARDRLAGGARADRVELLAALRDGGVATDGERGIHLLGNLAHRGVVVLTGRTEFALLAEQLRDARPREPDETLDELALRYFHGHGPATVRDLAWWTGLSLGTVRPAVDRVRDRLDVLEIDGVTHYLRPGLEAERPGVQLLPGFDEYLLGYTDRSAALSAEHADAVVPGGNGLFLPTVVVRGEIVGLWRRTRGRRGAQLELDPFTPLSATVERAAQAAARRYERFVQGA